MEKLEHKTQLEIKVETLDKRMEILEAGEVRFQRLIDEQLSAFTRVTLSNIAQMKTWLKDLQEHFESHNLDKKKREEYASKRKTKTRY